MIKSNKPKVSVILTSYNHGKYIRHAIESVLNQTFSDIELIIWDDASSDNSWEIINSYSDPRIKIFRNEENLRGNISRGLVISRGKYIAIHHSDDAWEPTKLEKQVAFFDQNPDIGAVFTHVQVIDEQGQPFTDENHFYYNVFDQPNRTSYEWLNYFFYKGNALCHPSLLIRKDTYDEVMYRQGLAQIPDLDFWVQLCLKHEIHIIQEKLTLFRVRDHEANVSGYHRENRVRGQFEFLQVLEHYKTIDSIDELTHIFPEAGKYVNQINPDILYALGRVAVETGLFNPIKLFGLNLLFNAINDPERSEILQKYQMFDQKKFIELTAEYDVFSVEDLQELKMNISKLTTTLVEQEQIIQNLTTDLAEREQSIQQLSSDLAEREQSIQQLSSDLAEREQSIQQLSSDLAEQEQTIQKLTSDLAEREEEVLFYALSKSWRFTRPFRKISSLIRGISKKFRQLNL